MNKQIEEMARVIVETERRKMDTHCDLPSIEEYATDLYNAGYRKQSEGEWITTPDIRPDRFAAYRHICVLCGYTYRSVIPRGGKFCPDCGAKMKGGE